MRLLLDTHIWIWSLLQPAKLLPRVSKALTGAVSLPHRDPADRFLAATALVHELTLVTADERLIEAAKCRVLANR